MLSYSQRASYALNEAGKRLLELMDSKQTNLILAADVTTGGELLALADSVGPEICALKTHIDIVEDFSFELIHKLRFLSEKHSFLLFEDRKFADIGNTVKWQYRDGLYRISDWADLITAHILPGYGIIKGLKEVGLPKGRGVVLLAQMSSEGNLAKGAYTKEAAKLACEHEDFVAGLICREKLVDSKGLIHMTPGVQIESEKDNLGQVYLTPERVIEELKSDVIIVGRGIYGSRDIVSAAKKYRNRGWGSYLKLLQN